MLLFLSSCFEDCAFELFSQETESCFAFCVLFFMSLSTDYNFSYLSLLSTLQSLCLPDVTMILDLSTSTLPAKHIAETHPKSKRKKSGNWVLVIA